MARDFALLLFQPFRIEVIIEIDFALKPKLIILRMIESNKSLREKLFRLHKDNICYDQCFISLFVL